jgi:hypothetical protein
VATVGGLRATPEVAGGPPEELGEIEELSFLVLY